MTIRSVISSPVKRVIGSNSSTTSFSRLLSLLRSKGGQLYMAGPANNEFIDKSGVAPDGIGTDLIGFARNLAADELGPELVTPDAWAAATNVSQAGGRVIFSGTAAPDVSINQLNKLIIGAIYEVTFTVVALSSGTGFRIGCGTGAFTNIRSAAGTYTQRVVCAGTTALYLQSMGSGVVGEVRDISVREVRAAYQMTTAAKPKLVREPILGPELVLRGDGTSTAGWSNQGATIAASGGEFIVTATGTLYPAVNYILATEVGKKYLLRGQIRQGTFTSNATIEIGGGVVSRSNPTTAMRHFEGEFTATLPNHRVFLTLGSATATVGQTIIADNISVREILGYKDVWSWEFDGVDDFTRGAVSPITGAPGALICVALAPLRVPPSNDIYLTNKAAGGSGGGTMFINGEQARVAFSLGDGVDAVYLFDTAPYGAALGAWRVYTLWRDGNTLRLRKDGVELQAGSVAAVDAFTPDRALILGGNWNGTITYNPGNCRMQAPVILQGITTLAQVQQVEREVARLAGVTLP